jgi:hypothetical protein
MEAYLAVALDCVDYLTENWTPPDFFGGHNFVPSCDLARDSCETNQGPGVCMRVTWRISTCVTEATLGGDRLWPPFNFTANILATPAALMTPISSHPINEIREWRILAADQVGHSNVRLRTFFTKRKIWVYANIRELITEPQVPFPLCTISLTGTVCFRFHIDESKEVKEMKPTL